MAKTVKNDLVRTLILLPKDLRTELELIRQASGLTLSQQARTSLTLWVAKCRKVPAQSLFAKGFGGQLPGLTDSVPNGPAPEVAPFDPGPEPDQAADPVAWSKWAARAGNAAIAKLAKGEW
jgi:hypothetical protein